MFLKLIERELKMAIKLAVKCQTKEEVQFLMLQGTVKEKTRGSKIIIKLESEKKFFSK